MEMICNDILLICPTIPEKLAKCYDTARVLGFRLFCKPAAFEGRTREPISALDYAGKREDSLCRKMVLIDASPKSVSAISRNGRDEMFSL
jgi:hypothetical protein